MKTYLAIAALALATTAFANQTVAAPLGVNLGQAADGLGVVEQAQFRWGGREYCWYPDGWRGPGFYWCGFNLRRGLGWGGPAGWRGWHHGGPGPRLGGPRVGGPRVVGPRVGGPRVGGPRVGGPRVGGGGGPKGGGFKKH